MKLGERVYGQFCPVAMGAEIFATRWTPIVLRELLSGSTRFSELQRGMPLMSRSLLARRLQELEQAGLVEKRAEPDGRGPTWHLTEAGEALRPVVIALGDWAHHWLTREIPEHDLDPSLLMWDMRRTVDAAGFPTPARTVVQFQFPDVQPKQRLWWLLAERGLVELCWKRPAPDNDLEVTALLADMVLIWIDRLPLSAALTDGRIRLDGPPTQRDAFSRWFRPGRGKHR